MNDIVPFEIYAHLLTPEVTDTIIISSTRTIITIVEKYINDNILLTRL